MFQTLVSHNDDIRRLVEKGYAIAFDSKCMVIRDIPYLNNEQQLQWGAIVTKLVFTDLDHVEQDDHQVFFAGSVPYGLDGKPIPNLGGGITTLTLSEACADVVVQRSFSNKPMPLATGRFADFFEKIQSYVHILSGPAIESFGVTPLTFRVVESSVVDPIFKVHDTLTSRAEITELSAKFNQDVVAVIGLGGTGSYLLDLLVKTPVGEIRGFDSDLYHVHNAFRSPGRLIPTEFNQPKADLYQDRYDNFRHGLTITRKHIDPTCSSDLEGVTFAFVCVDKGSSRAGIFELLLSKGIPFIDVGMGLKRQEGALTGMLRATYYSSEQGQAVRDMQLAELSEDPDNIYRTNIQIGELNALNACLAILRFKQLRGFYLESDPGFHYLFNIGKLSIAKLPEDNAD
jgi:hypothetical protein